MQKEYMSPKIIEKTIELNFFLKSMGIMDSFNIFGTVYAQSGGGGGGDNSGDNVNCGCGGPDISG